MDVSVIIVSWNTRSLLLKCLKSVVEALQEYDHDIFVIDNASSDGSPTAVESNYPGAQLIANETNLGFSRANNLGLRLSSAEYALCLNPDTVLSKTCFALLYQFLRAHKDGAAVGAKLLNTDGTPQGWDRGNFPTTRRIFNHSFFLSHLFPQSDHFQGFASFGNPPEPVEVDWVAATCMLLRKEAIDQVGLFDESIFMYGEDLDLCWRLRSAGWGVHYHPQATIVHYGGQSFIQQDDRFIQEIRSTCFLSARQEVGPAIVDRSIFIMGLVIRLIVQTIVAWAAPTHINIQKRRKIRKYLTLSLPSNPRQSPTD